MAENNKIEPMEIHNESDDDDIIVHELPEESLKIIKEIIKRTGKGVSLWHNGCIIDILPNNK